MKAEIKPASVLVTEEVIRAYADLTNDFNPIHLDPEFAAKTPMGGVIAHGTMSICLLWKAVFETFEITDVGVFELAIRFVRPVRQGEVLTAAGIRSDEADDLYSVWVKNDQGAECVGGTLRVLDEVRVIGEGES